MHYLEIPAEVLDRADARELMRFWVCEGQDFVALHTDLFGQKEPEVWGTIAADVLKHAIIALKLSDDTRDPIAIRDRMIEAFHERMASHGDYSGRRGP
jgi:hypothetical protein